MLLTLAKRNALPLALTQIAVRAVSVTSDFQVPSELVIGQFLPALAAV